MTTQYNALPDLCQDLPKVSQRSLDAAVEWVEEEHDKLLALAFALVHRLEPVDPQNPTDTDDLTSWRFAQMLEERLSSPQFTDTLRSFLLGPQP